MNKKQFQNLMFAAHCRGTLITDKHNPYKMAALRHPSYRTVVSHELAADENLMDVLHYSPTIIRRYRNTNPYHSPEYFTVEPLRIESVAASGVAEGQVVAFETCDLLISVNGNVQGWHTFGEKAAKVSQKEQQNKIILLNEWY